MRLALLFFLGLWGLNCTPSRVSYFQEPQWVAVGLGGQEIAFSLLPYEKIALNVYSPDCVPCWKEIPALNHIETQWFRGQSRAKLFVGVDPYQILPDAKPEDPWSKVLPLAQERMKQEIAQRGILPEVVFLKRPFQVAPDALVTGTPETLLLETNPLRLYYNFIGSISEATDPKAIESSYKVRFLKYQLGLEPL